MTNGNGMGGFTPGMVTGIGNMVDGAITTLHDVTIRKQEFISSDPCAGAVAFAEVVANWIGPVSDDIAGGSAALSSGLSDAVSASLLSRGRPAAGVSGGQPLAEFVLQQAAPAPLVPPWIVSLGPPAVAAYMDGLLPSGSDLLAGNVNRWSPSVGSSVPGISGLYISNAGKLTGPAMRDWVANWVGTQVGTNGPTPALFPAARLMLQSLAGSFTGSARVGGWAAGFWRPSDGYQPGSKGARIAAALVDAAASRDELERYCGGGRIAEAALPFVALAAAVFIFSRG